MHPTKAFKWIGIIKHFEHAQSHNHYDSMDPTKCSSVLSDVKPDRTVSGAALAPGLWTGPMSGAT